MQPYALQSFATASPMAPSPRMSTVEPAIEPCERQVAEGREGGEGWREGGREEEKEREGEREREREERREERREIQWAACARSAPLAA